LSLLQFVRYLETLKEEGVTEKIRDVFERACTIHHPMKPSLHLHWSEFEESQSKYFSKNILQKNYARNLIQGCCASGKPGKPGKIREFNFALENLEKSGNFTPLSGKTIFFSKINFGVYFGQ